MKEKIAIKFCRNEWQQRKKINSFLYPENFSHNRVANNNVINLCSKVKLSQLCFLFKFIYFFIMLNL